MLKYTALGVFQFYLIQQINLTVNKNMVTIYLFNQIGAIMSQVIRISENLYQRLSTYAKGFETPSQVIENMVNFYENKNNIKPQENTFFTTKRATKLEIIYHPVNDVETFKQDLINTKIAYIKLYKINNEIEIKEWSANRFNNDSDVVKNLRSGYLRKWKDKGIFKAELSTNKELLS